MLYELENNLDTLLVDQINGNLSFYHHNIEPVALQVLGHYSFQNKLTALGEIEGSETSTNYGQTLSEAVTRALAKYLTEAAIKRLEKAREDFKVTKATVLEEGYVLVDYHHGDKRYFGMAKPGEPTEFLDSEYAAVMSVKPIGPVEPPAPSILQGIVEDFNLVKVDGAA